MRYNGNVGLLQWLANIKTPSGQCVLFMEVSGVWALEMGGDKSWFL